MRAGSIVGVAILVAVLLAGCALSASGHAVDDQSAASFEGEPSTPGNDTVVLTSTELFAEVDADPADHDSELYYVAENGTWYRADAGGSVGEPASDGPALPRADDDHAVPREERPKYLWKVVSSDGCDVSFHDATNVSDSAHYPVPSCPPPTPPTGSTVNETGTPGDGETEPGTEGGSGTDGEDGPAQPGFGVVVSLAALLLASRLLPRL